MKKIRRSLISIGTAICLLSLSVSSVFAYFVGNTIVWGDPTAVSANKGVTFTADILTPPDLPGTFNGSSGMILPLGFASGQVQFGGNGIKISGLTSAETVKVCFSFPTYRFSWAGSIYSWDGIKWVAMPTTIIPAVGDSTNTLACTSAAGNGIYTLIIHFYGTPEPFREPA